MDMIMEVNLSFSPSASSIVNRSEKVLISRLLISKKYLTAVCLSKN